MSKKLWPLSHCDLQSSSFIVGYVGMVSTFFSLMLLLVLNVKQPDNIFASQKILQSIYLVIMFLNFLILCMQVKKKCLTGLQVWISINSVIMLIIFLVNIMLLFLRAMSSKDLDFQIAFSIAGFIGGGFYIYGLMVVGKYIQELQETDILVKHNEITMS